MTLYIQHGHGKSDKITQALDDSSAGGVILAARNEKVSNLDSFVASLCGTYTDPDLLFDSQFFVSAISPPNERFLSEYPFYEAGRAAGDFVGSRKLATYVKSALDFQIDRPFTRVTTPTVMVDSFADRWSQIALQLADGSIDYHAGKPNAAPLLVSVLLSENALSNRSELDSFLDIVTSWDVQGFYLVIARQDPTYSQMMDPDRLAHLLYLIYVLGDRNGYELVCGYSDFIGILCRAAGASAFGNGWYQSLRQFHVKSFLKRKSGGSRPVLRYSSAPLLNSIRLSELESIHDAGYLDKVLSGVPLDSAIRPSLLVDSAAWNSAISERHHWQTLSSLDSTLSGKVKPDMRSLHSRVREARGILTLLTSEGVPFDKPSAIEQHYNDWMTGIRRFAGGTGL